jgi:protein SMG7
MQTSYTFISSYKQRIAALDNAVNVPSRSQQKQQSRQGGHGPVEYRKLLQRFRQFLAEEEKFWSQLVVRFRRSFHLDEAHHALVTLGILPNQPEGNVDATEDHNPSALNNGRNHFQFPSNDSGVSLAPKTPAERESRLAILSKTLVCLGDIARYRELYHEGGGRPKAGHEESMPLKRTGRSKRGGAAGVEVIPRARNYDKAQHCYEQARLLVPYEGNPSHQLAILASYKKDAFGSLVHYYRALCVRQPYDTASENLGTLLTKSLDQWSARVKREMGSPKDTSVPLAPRLRVEAFKEKVVALHALWRLGVEKCVERLLQTIFLIGYRQDGFHFSEPCGRCPR